MTKLSYAGIGSRKTPVDVLEIMGLIGQQLAPMWTLRSGFADGADQAFSNGAFNAGGQAEIYLPWRRFNEAPTRSEDGRFVDMAWINGTNPELYRHAMLLAEKHHPAWYHCSRTVQIMHTRNVFQVLGEDLQSPATMVVCWTPSGFGGGGTGQALRIAQSHGVPVFDLALPTKVEELCAFVSHTQSLQQSLNQAA